MVTTLLTTDTTTITLRDYFAGIALLALPKDALAQYDQSIAKKCYYIADEMLGVR